MAGTKEGGAKAKASNLKRNPNFYKELGAKGGKKGKKDGAIKGFAHSHERAVEAGRKGGHLGKRGKAKQYTNHYRINASEPNLSGVPPSSTVVLTTNEPAPDNYVTVHFSVQYFKKRTIIDKILRRK